MERTPASPTPPPKKKKNRKGLTEVGPGRIYSMDGDGPRLVGQRGVVRHELGANRAVLIRVHCVSSLAIRNVEPSN